MADIDERTLNNEPENQDETPEQKINRLIAELAEMKATNSKQKNALDKALKNNGDLTKQLRAKMTADEQEEEAKREEQERQKAEIEELKTFKRLSLAKERYMTQGMSADIASQAADAEINNDMDLLSQIQKQFQDAQLKQAKAEWLASRPHLNNGGAEGECNVTKEQFARMGYNARLELMEKYPETYKRLTGRN